MFENLSDRLERSFKIIKGEGHDFSTESLISELNYFFDGLKAENKGNRKNQVRLEGEENE